MPVKHIHINGHQSFIRHNILYNNVWKIQLGVFIL